MPTIRLSAFYACVLLGLALVLVLLPGRSTAAVPTDTITLTAPNNVTIAEGEDYATQTLHNPADMNDLGDLSYPVNFTWPTISNGIWQATTTAANASIFVQFQGFAGAYSWLGQKDGPNYPVDTQRFTHLRFRANVSQSGSSVVYWFAAHAAAPLGNSGFITWQTGWHIYDVDLTAGSNWSSQPVAGVRLDPPLNTPNNTVQFDWVRLSAPTSPAVQISWTYTSSGTPTVNLYASTDPNPNGADEMLIASVPANTGGYSWTGAGMAPGTYYIHAVMNGARAASGPLVISPRPIVNINAPSPLSGEDYAAARLATLWDENNPGQFPVTYNIGPILYTPNYLQASATTNDPQAWWLAYDQAHAIDTSRYRYMNMRLWLAHPTNPAAYWANVGPRMTWSIPINLDWQQTTAIVAPYDQWLPVAFDLPNVPLVSGTTGWTGQVTTLRFDMHEQDESGSLPPFFRIDKAHLTAQPQSNGATLIRWTPLQGSGTVDLYYDTDNVGYNGTAIVGGIPLGSGSYTWNTATLPNGANYYVYIVTHDTLGNVADFQYSLVPVVINHSAPSSIFSDVPTNNTFATYINDMATRGIMSGYVQSDGTILFSGGNTTTRGQMAKIIANGRGYNETIPGGQQTFTDVPNTNPFWVYIERVVLHNIISGYSSSPPCTTGVPCFLPGNNVTRGQIAKMIVNAWGYSDAIPSTRQTFTDVPYSNPFWLFIERVALHNVISGYNSNPPCGTGVPCFLSGNNVTRGQTAKMISIAGP